MEEVEEILRQLAHFGATLEWRRGKLLCHTLQERPLPISLQERIKNSKVREYLRARMHRKQFDAPMRTAQEKCAGLGEWISLTPTQERIWAFCELWPENQFYNMPLALALQGDLDVPALMHAFECMVQRHSALRLKFAEEGGVVKQRVATDSAIQIPITDISGTAGHTQQRRLDEIISAESRQAFNLRTEAVIRVRIVRLESCNHVLLLTLHHICADGWSVGVLLNDAACVYRQIMDEAQVPLPSVPEGFDQYVRWLNRYLTGEFLQEKLSFWEETLRDAPSSIKLPTDSKRSVLRRGARERLTVRSDLIDAVTEFSANARVSLYCAIHAALSIVLHRWSRQNDLVIGTVSSGRFHPNTHSAVGCFMNSIALRAKIKSDSTLHAVTAAVGAAVADSYPYQDCPFEHVVQALKAGSNQGINPLFNVALLLQNYPIPKHFAAGVGAAIIPTYAGGADLDLRYIAGDLNGSFVIVCEYNAELFDGDTVRLTLKGLSKTLEMMVQRPDTLVQDLDYFGDLEQHAVRQSPARAGTLHVAGNFNVDPIEDSLTYWLEEIAPPMSLSVADYDQAYQQLLKLQDPGQEGDTTAVFIRLADWMGNADQPQAARVQLLQSRCDEFCELLVGQLSRTRRAVIIVICPSFNDTHRALTGNDDLLQLQRRFGASLEVLPGVHIITPEDVFRAFGDFEYVEPYGFEIGHIPYTREFYDAVGTQVARKLAALRRAPYKVIAVDCDNTLWSGICGELGAGGVTLSNGHLRLQKFLLSARDCGMLLCLCSKNNVEEVRAVFDRPDMALRWEHISGHRINWSSKSTNIVGLADELNVGTETFIFLDDSAMECAEVSAAGLGACVLQLPDEPDEFEMFLHGIWEFDIPVVSGEARRRARMYSEETTRQAASNAASSLEAFLEGLELNVEFNEVNAQNVERIAELTQRTNQFNLSNKRRSAQEIRYACTIGGLRGKAINVSDRFGSYGLTGIFLYSVQTPYLVVDTFALSCRVLGRRVEHSVVQYLCEMAIADGCKCLRLPYVRSDRNKPMLEFLMSVPEASIAEYEGAIHFELEFLNRAPASDDRYRGAVAV